MRFHLQALSLISLLGLGFTASAQLDSSNALLLRTNPKTVTPQNLDSGRYKIRAPESRRDDDEIEEKAGAIIPSPVPARTPKPKSKSIKKDSTGEIAAGDTNQTAEAGKPDEDKKSSPPKPGASHENAISPNAAAAPSNEVREDDSASNAKIPNANVPGASAASENGNSAKDATLEEEIPPPVFTQVRELILGGTPEDIAEYKKQVHPQDPRANVLDISLAPAYYYNDSSSEYSFRRYTSTGPAFGLGMNLWVTPFFGLQSKFFSSVSASQRSGGVNTVPTDIQSFDAGIRFRKHFGYSRKAAQLSWGIDYHDSMNKISAESQTAIGRKSYGFSLSLEGVVPTSVTYAHTFQLDVRPRLKHSETDTGVAARSGTKNETNTLGLSLGGQWTLDRRNQVFWRTQYTVERSLFEGDATVIDPHNDQVPHGVSVTNSLVIFYFGFKWGS